MRKFDNKGKYKLVHLTCSMLPEEKKKSLSPFRPLSRRGLNPTKPVYDPDQPDSRLNLTASAFNQLVTCSSPGRRGYCYAELAVFFPSGGRNHRQYSLRLPTEGRPGWVSLGGWLWDSLPARRQSPIPLLTGLNVEQLRWSRPIRYRYTDMGSAAGAPGTAVAVPLLR